MQTDVTTGTQTWKCLACGALSTRRTVRGQRPKWCAVCRSKGMTETALQRRCRWCGRPGVRTDAIYCSRLCARPRALPAPPPPPSCAIPRRHPMYQPKSTGRRWVGGRCLRCGDSFLSWTTNGEDPRWCSDRCRNLDGSDRARARKAGVEVDWVARWRVFSDHNHTCHICGDTIDQVLQADPQHPDAPSVDHVVPLASGGPHRQTNLRPAHRRCNEEKGIEETGLPY